VRECNEHSVMEVVKILIMYLGMWMASCKRNVVDFIISKSSVTKKSQLEAVRVQRAYVGRLGT
jgi:hypothetical protein